jgi:hypothetical protein
MFAEIELPGGGAVAKAIGNEGDNLLLAGSEHLAAARVDDTERRSLRDKIEEESELLCIGPNLSVGDALNAAAEQAEMRIRNAKQTSGPGAKCVEYEVPVIGLEQKHFGDGGMREVHPA